ncbi:MAG: TauD/TfdA dioxygenase family protein [Vicinamibacteria bacterium]
MEIFPTGGALGAEVKGVDVSRPLDDATVRALQRAALDHLLLLFRDQKLSDEGQVRFSRYFGDPRPHVREQSEREVQEIFVVSNVVVDGKPIGALGYGELTFHSDLSYLQRPGSFSIVYAVEVPASGGDTQWANAYTAYDALPEALRDRVLPLTAIHRHGEEKQNPEVPASHPVVRTHPGTGRRALFVSPQFTRRIEGVSEEESAALLEALFTHLARPQFVWTHKWRAGDLVLWDNRCTLHRREPFDERERRILKRTQMFGEVPYL